MQYLFGYTWILKVIWGISLATIYTNHKVEVLNTSIHLNQTPILKVVFSDISKNSHQRTCLQEIGLCVQNFNWEDLDDHIMSINPSRLHPPLPTAISVFPNTSFISRVLIC